MPRPGPDPMSSGAARGRRATAARPPLRRVLPACAPPRTPWMNACTLSALASILRAPVRLARCRHRRAASIARSRSADMLQPFASWRSMTVMVEMAPALFASSLASDSLAVAPSLQHVGGAELVQRGDPADREILAGGDLVRPLEGRACRVHVARPLRPPDDLQRIERDVGRPAVQAGRLGLPERPVSELASLAPCHPRRPRSRRRLHRPGWTAPGSPRSSAMARAAARCSAASAGLSSDMVRAALTLISASRRGSIPAVFSLPIS